MTGKRAPFFLQSGHAIGISFSIARSLGVEDVNLWIGTRLSSLMMEVYNVASAAIHVAKRVALVTGRKGNLCSIFPTYGLILD